MAMKIKSNHIVKPAQKTFNGILPLSELDQILTITSASHLYFYEKPTQEEWLINSSNNKILETLKDSLSRVLVPFYPLAGRLRWIGGGRFELDCNAEGAVLIEVESDMKIADYGDFYSCTENFQNLLVELDYFGTPMHDLPLLAVQVTRFACGGLCIGMSMSHVVVDGKSAFHFTEEWARLAQGLPIEVEPFLDRRILLAEDGVNNYESNIKEEIEAKNQNVDYFSNMEKGKVVSPTFVLLAKDMIERLKVVANNNNNNNNNNSEGSTKGGESKPYSRYEVISAYLWKCVSMARKLKAEDMTTLLAYVDSRRRTEAPLPSSYFGNGIVEIEIPSRAGEIMSNPLSNICNKIRGAISRVTKEYVMEKIEFYKRQKSVTKYQFIDDRGKEECVSVGENYIIVTSWLNMEGRDIDFGWGKEVYMGPSIAFAADGDIMLFPFKNDGSVVIGICLENKLLFQECMSVVLEEENF